MSDTPSTALNDYIATMADEGDHYLGLVTVFSVSKVDVPHHELEAHLTRVGLAEYVPGRPADADVFRRTSKRLQRNRQATGDAGVSVNVMVRDVADDEDQIVRRLVCELVDRGNRTLGYSEVYDLVFTKPSRKHSRSSNLDVRRIGESVHPAADEVATEIVSEYNRLVGTVDDGAIRNVISRALDGAHAVSLRPGGGCYFADRSEAKVIAGLEDFASHIPGTMVHSIPLPDDLKQRANLIDAVEDQSKTDIEREMVEIRELLTKGEPVSGRILATHAARYRSLEQRATRYAGLLETALGSTNMALVGLKMQMAKLAGVGSPVGAAVPTRKAA